MGRVDAREFVKLQSKARVTCDVEYAAVEIHSGAILQGRLLQRQQATRTEEPQETGRLVQPELASASLAPA